VIPKIAEEIEARKKLKELRESKESFDRRNPAHKHVTKKARTTFSGPSSIEDNSARKKTIGSSNNLA
jgi:hypothetical protein